MDSIHGHEMLSIVIESGEQYTHASLEAAIKACLGGQARFRTCLAEGMTAGELVAFLVAKGEFIPSKDGFSADQSKICRHRFETAAVNLPPENISFACQG